MKRKLIEKAKDLREAIKEKYNKRCEVCGERIITEPGERWDDYFQRYEPKGHSRWGTAVDDKQYYCADCVEVESL